MTSTDTIDAALGSGESSEIIAILLTCLVPYQVEDDCSMEVNQAALSYLSDHLFEDTRALPTPLSLPDLIGGAGFDDLGALPRQSSADAREILMTLLQLVADDGPGLAPGDTATYVALLQTVYRQLVVDTIHRRHRQTAKTATTSGDSHVTTTELADAIKSTLGVWGRDVLAALEGKVLRTLCREDAIVTQAPCSLRGKGNDGGPSTDGAADDLQDSEVSMSADVARLASVTVTLLGDLQGTTADLQCQCAVAAAALYAAVLGSQQLTKGAVLALPRPDGTLISAQIVLSDRNGGEVPAACEDAAVYSPSIFEGMAHTLGRCAADVIHQGFCCAPGNGPGVLPGATSTPSSLSALLSALSASLSADADAQMSAFGGLTDAAGAPVANDDYLFDDWEQGLGPDYGKNLAIRQARDLAAAKVTVWADWPASVDSAAAAPTWRNVWPPTLAPLCEDTVRLAAAGALFLLTTETSSCHLSGERGGSFVADSPAGTLSVCIEAYKAALSLSSAVLVCSAVVLLQTMVGSIPKYSVPFPSESGQPVGLGGGDSNLSGTDITRASHSRGFVKLFNLVKQLVTLSTMCPVEYVRDASQALTLSTLALLEEGPRLRMQWSLVALSPFPSVCRSLFDDLAHQWGRQRNGEKQSRNAASAGLRPETPFDQIFPEALVAALVSFAQKLQLGDAQFADPLIVALNFVRTFAADDRRTNGRRLIFDEHGKLAPSAGAALSGSWVAALFTVRDRVLPQCQTILGNDAPDTKDDDPVRPASTFSMAVALSPLDEFSLTSAVDAVAGLF